jgi:AcrR family transcriptional regulator
VLQKGRPREFDCDEALDRALEVFWRKGYEGASLAELTEAMGINRPSLYAAFGNKEALFRRALDRYADGPAAYTREALNAPTARKVAERLLLGAADALTDPCHPPGCLGVMGALTCGEAAEKLLKLRLERAKSEGDLPAETNCADLARLVMTITQGMSVQAAGGASRKDLRKVAEMSLLAWPT